MSEQDIEDKPEIIESEANRDHQSEESRFLEKAVASKQDTSNKDTNQSVEKERFKEENNEEQIAEIAPHQDLQEKRTEQALQIHTEQSREEAAKDYKNKNHTKKSVIDSQSVESKKQRQDQKRAESLPPSGQSRNTLSKPQTNRDQFQTLFQITESLPPKIYPVDIKVKKMRPKLVRLAYIYSPVYANDNKSQISGRTYLVGMEKSLLSVEVTGKELLKPDFEKEKFYELERLNLEKINAHSGTSMRIAQQKNFPIDSTMSEGVKPKFIVETIVDPKSGISTHRSPTPIDKLKYKIHEKAFGAVEMLELQSRRSNSALARKMPMKKNTQLDSINNTTLAPLDISAYYTNIEDFSKKPTKLSEIKSNLSSIDNHSQLRSELAAKDKGEKYYSRAKRVSDRETPSFSYGESNTFDPQNSSSYLNNSRNSPDKPAKNRKSPYETPIIPMELIKGDPNIIGNLERDHERKSNPFWTLSSNTKPPKNVIDSLGIPELPRGRSMSQKKGNANQKVIFSNTKLPSIFSSNPKNNDVLNRLLKPKNQKESSRFSSVPKQRAIPIEN